MLLGIDIGGTKCAVIVGQEHGSSIPLIIDKIVLPTSGTANDMIRSILDACTTLMNRQAATERISAVGICCGGPLSSKEGMILSPPNLPGWDNIPIVRIVQEQLGIPASLQNDANAGAVAEWKYGAGKGLEHMVFLTFGTGMGAGLILNGKLYAGANDFAGEVGHIRMAITGPVGYGKAGSFEGFCSGGGIAQLAATRAMEVLQMGGSTLYCNSMDQLPTITAQTVAEAADKGDADALAVYAESGAYLGKGLAVLIDILNPEAIIIGGIYTRARHLLEPAMRAHLAYETLSGPYKRCSILPSALGEQIGDYAALAVAGNG